LLETAQKESTLEGLRNICLELLLVGVTTNPEKLTVLHKVINLDLMLSNCIILEGSSSARHASKLLLKLIAELSKDTSATIKV
jgi:hypothetical protein